MIKEIDYCTAIRIFKNERPELIFLYKDYYGVGFALNKKGIYLGLINEL